jgi:predicted dehydrogenase
MREKKLRVALIGCGRIAVKHIMAITKKNSGLLLCAVAGNDPGALDKLLDAGKLPGKKKHQLKNTVNTYTDYNRMLEMVKRKISNTL